MHGVGITVLDGAATYQEILDYHAARIHRVPRLRQKLAFVPFNLTHPKWVDDPEFRLENHIVQHKVPASTTLKKAREIALELGEPLLDRTRPLWKTYVIENVEGKTVLAQMNHHAFVDGATAIAMSIALTDNEPDAGPPEPGPEWSPAPVPSPNELWMEASTEIARGATQVVTGNNLPNTELLTRANGLFTRMAEPVIQAPWNAGVVGPKRRFATFERHLDDFRPIRKALGGTINDIVVAVSAEGAARYMVGKGTDVQGQRLRLMCPVNVRSEDDDPLAGGNRVSAMFPLLSAAPLGMENRYAEVREEMQRIKDAGEPETLDQLQHIQPSLPPLAMAATLGVGTQFDPTAVAARWPLPVVHAPGPRPQQTGFNFTCTNVAGPNWQQYIAGYPVERTVGTLMLGGNLGLGVGVGSMNNLFTFGFTVDPRLVPDVERIRDETERCFAELAQLAQ